MTTRTRFALWSAALHGVWEYAQCPPFYDMTGLPKPKHDALMLAATAGDVAINLGVGALAGRLVGREPVRRLTPSGTAALLGVGFAAAVGLEWAAQRLDLWSYTDQMPTVRVAGHDVGLLPIVQVTVLPALAAWATRRTDPST
ncbi:hypothetical protein B1759_15835 [Rubrivirga sp. SAORIC476]|jgi:hypothetical protein|uniref:hypothetical protein n=1 Tax=Rubrivirga sp. SAORIC476 TaxID=1961794 RepID=UPI000BA8F047|nr:hypothetical protein [Rubrivirga sp. SAORIC476]PAP78908.1 hypothetical protein B1759_15835 [Rubrivirga sp. SAORIC476]